MKIIYFTEKPDINKYKRLSQYVTCCHNWQQYWQDIKVAAKSGGGQGGLKSGGGQQW